MSSVPRRPASGADSFRTVSIASLVGHPTVPPHATGALAEESHQTCVCRGSGAREAWRGGRASIPTLALPGARVLGWLLVRDQGSSSPGEGVEVLFPEDPNGSLSESGTLGILSF